MPRKQKEPRLPGEPSLNKPSGRRLSTAMERLYDQWGLYQDSTNPLYTTFKYSRLTGIGKERGVTRRDPSTVLKIGSTYYAWYTKRKTERDLDPLNLPGPRREQDWDVPVSDWDIAEIWYATSDDGFDWTERGAAVLRGPRDAFDGRSVFTPDVLVFDDRYYLYYQAVDHPYTRRTRNTIGMSWAESPDGPWHRCDYPVLEPGIPGDWLGDDDSATVKRYGAWDSHKVHDPFAMVRDGRIWLYYKGQPMGWGTAYCRGIGWGVAMADCPEGPFEKSPLNPVTNSGHETCLFPYGEGVLAICGHDGPEKDTIQYAPDGLNFQVRSHVILPPLAGGPFAPDSYSGTKNGQGILWGLSHIATEELKSGNSYIVRFDCNLRKGLEREGFGRTNVRLIESVYFSADVLMATEDPAPATAPLPEKPSEERPAGPISEAMKRVYQTYGVYKDQQSPFFTAFKYTSVTGIGKETGVTRRDPTKVIHTGDVYHVWYTRRQTEDAPAGFDGATESVPVWDWDLADIWHATSPDGVHWEEQGLAVPRGPAGAFDDRSVLTPDVLAFGGKYYLYYQVLQGPYRQRSVYQVGMSWADSPDGPWHRWPDVIIPVGTPPILVGDDDDPDAISRFGAWDSHKIHDPYVLVRDGKIWIYYKGVGYGRHYRHDLGCKWGLAIADRPEGPFEKHPLNPVTNSGHETFLYPFRGGIAAVTSLEGPEKNTVQYASDGVNFGVMGKVSVPPVAAGPYVPDAFTDTKHGQGVTWGLAHLYHGREGTLENSYIIRFDCDLTDGPRRAGFYRPWNFRFPEEAYFTVQNILSGKERDVARKLMERFDTQTQT